MVTKSNTVVIAAIVAALATPGVAIPAFARNNQTPTWDTCYALAVERGSGPGMGATSNPMKQYQVFMNECLAGKIPLSADASTPMATSQARAHAPTVASKHISRHAASAK